MREKKDPRGRKVGFYVPGDRLEDLFTALRVNGRKLAEILDIAPSLIVHWKQTHNIDPRHLKAVCKLLERVKVQDGDHRAAWKRITSHLAQFKTIQEASGSAVSIQDNRSALSESVTATVTSDVAKTVKGDLSRVHDRILIAELNSRGWDTSKMLLEAAKTQISPELAMRAVLKAQKEVRRERKTRR